MSKRHFEAIAKTLRDATYLTDKNRGRLANDIADELAKFNSAFNRYQFLKACGVIS